MKQSKQKLESENFELDDSLKKLRETSESESKIAEKQLNDLRNENKSLKEQMAN